MLPELRANHRLHPLISYLFGDRKGIAESASDTCERCVDSVNAYFDTETFSASRSPQDSFRIGCQCGWSLNIALPAALAPEMVPIPLVECLRRMVLHYEIRHDGLRGAGILQ
jgi:hypothetical protein